MALVQRPAAYHLLPLAEKQALAAERMAEPPMACPVDCGTSLLPADVLKHVNERCPGPRPPGPASRWISHREALAAGVPRGTLSFWAAHGDVRTRGQAGGKQYLLRDLTHRILVKRLSRRR
jgi:hypothetical protein